MAYAVTRQHHATRVMYKVEMKILDAGVQARCGEKVLQKPLKRGPHLERQQLSAGAHALVDTKADQQLDQLDIIFDKINVKSDDVDHDLTPPASLLLETSAPPLNVNFLDASICSKADLNSIDTTEPDLHRAASTENDLLTWEDLFSGVGDYIPVDSGAGVATTTAKVKFATAAVTYPPQMHLKSRSWKELIVDLFGGKKNRNKENKKKRPVDERPATNSPQHGIVNTQPPVQNGPPLPPKTPPTHIRCSPLLPSPSEESSGSAAIASASSDELCPDTTKRRLPKVREPPNNPQQLGTNHALLSKFARHFNHHRQRPLAPVVLDFKKRPVGPLKNPNPMFFDGMPIGLTPAHREYWAWLDENGWFDDQGNIMTPRTREISLEEVEDSWEDFSEDEEQEEPDVDGQENGTRLPFLAGLDGAADEDPVHENQTNVLRCQTIHHEPMFHVQEISTIRPGAASEAISQHRRPNHSPPTNRHMRVGALQEDVLKGHVIDHEHMVPVQEISTIRPRAASEAISQPRTPKTSPRHMSVSALQEISMADPNSYPVIIQQAPLARRLTEPSHAAPPYTRPFNRMSDPLAALEREIHTEQQTHFAQIRSLTPWRNLSELTEAKPPPGNPSTPKKPRAHSWSPLKRRRASTASVPPLTPTIPDPLDSRRILLTPPPHIPTYPTLGTPEHFRAQIQHPLFRFSRDGYLVRSALTMELVRLFRDPGTKPEWSDAVPGIYDARKKDKGVDLEVDEWVLFWETLVVKADIRRGCRMAGLAAEGLWRRKRVGRA